MDLWFLEVFSVGWLLVNFEKIMMINELIIILLLLISGIIIYFVLKLNITEKSEFQKFKLIADKVKIDLTLANIKSNDWTDEIIINQNEYGGLNQLTGQADKNIKKIERVLNYLTVRGKYRGRTIEYGMSIEMDTDNLKLHLIQQKETILFIDPKNIDKKYLDLEFISD